MKIKHILTFSIMAILIIPQLSCKKEWAASIDDNTKVYMDELNRFYYLQAKLALNTDSNEEIDKLAEDPRYEKTMLNKADFLKDLVAQKLLYDKAISDKNIDKDELNAYAEYMKMQSVNQYYLMKKFKDRIAVSDEEINMEYSRNRSQFAGMTADQATNYIRQRLTSDKFRIESGRYVQNLMDEHKIDFDGLKEYQKKQGVTSGEDKPEENKPLEDKPVP
ncbi:MAG: hypothetical protein FWH53_07450 [Leptospirales bacterium]|nr:hypothetical protein [Leptospirales bacterium]